MNHVQLVGAALRQRLHRIVCLGNGLVMSNHHCARACIEGSAKTGEDFLSNGFYAAKREDERACPGLFLDELQEITDVTDRVSVAATPKMDPKTAAAERAKVTHAIEEECGKTAEDASCQVVSMYRGGQYKLYRFKRYKDIRLVFALRSRSPSSAGTRTTSPTRASIST